MNKKILKINERDNVLVALQDLEIGAVIKHGETSIELQEPIPSKHKFFTSDLHQGDDVIMYGVLVGKAQWR